MLECQKGRIPLLYTSAQSVCLTICYFLLCVWVCVHTHLGASEQQGYNHKPGVETCSSDHFTRMRPQIYGCVSMCKVTSAFSRETLCVTQDKLVFVRTAHKTQRASQNHSLGKMEKEHIMIPAPEFWLCVGLQWPTSGLCLKVSPSLL